MEYFLGSVLTFVFGFVLIKYFKSKNDEVSKLPKIRFSQSRIFYLTKSSYLYDNFENKNSQSYNYIEKKKIKVLFMKDDAYWIKNNSVYYSKIIDGVIDKENAKIVDMHSLDTVELEKMIFIVEKLTESIKDENWNSGN